MQVPQGAEHPQAPAPPFAPVEEHLEHMAGDLHMPGPSSPATRHYTPQRQPFLAPETSPAPPDSAKVGILVTRLSM